MAEGDLASSLNSLMELQGRQDHEIEFEMMDGVVSAKIPPRSRSSMGGDQCSRGKIWIRDMEMNGNPRCIFHFKIHELS